MKKLFIIMLVCFATLLCSCKAKDVEKLSVEGATGTTYYTINGESCLDGLDYESHDLNVSVVKIENDVLSTCLATYNPKFSQEVPKITEYKLAKDAIFYVRESDIVRERDGNIFNEVKYKKYTKEKFLKVFEKTENVKMYLWTAQGSEISIAMIYITTATQK